MKALIIGGTRGIGRATADLLKAQGWDVIPAGRETYDVHKQIIPMVFISLECDALVFCAGDLVPQFERAFDFPVAFYRTLITPGIIKDGGVIVAVSSVAADRPARVNPHYAAAKAALESYVRTISSGEQAQAHQWRVECVRFDLVNTDMLRLLPKETLEGRTIISAEDAALRIVERLYGK